MESLGTREGMGGNWMMLKKTSVGLTGAIFFDMKHLII